MSIIVPAWNEAVGIESVLMTLQEVRARGAELILVDGGSDDDTLERAAPWVDRVLRAPRGRAGQMNAGAAVAGGRALWFLHADTRVPAQADRCLLEALARGHHWGRFDVRLSGPGWRLRMIAWFMNRRSCLTAMTTGDQGMFVTREAFQSVGGFPDIPLMEDLALSRVLRKRGRPACIRLRLTTSSRRWEARGVWRTVGQMWWLRLRYALGTDPQALARTYYD